jgi:cob(I)alamin adenosyltransferase
VSDGALPASADMAERPASTPGSEGAQPPGAQQPQRPGTRAGDTGYTDLLGKRRVPKHDPVMEALGTLDEATSLLGIARRAATQERTRRLIQQMQQDLYELMAELAFPPAHAGAVRIDASHVAWLDRSLARVMQSLPALTKFVLPGASDASAPTDVARATVRTAERRLVQLAHDGTHQNANVLAYINRLSLLLFYLARAEDVAAGVDFDLAGAPVERAEA